MRCWPKCWQAIVFLACDNAPVQVILCAAFGLCHALHLSGPSLPTTFWHSRDECPVQEKKPLAFPNRYQNTKASPALHGTPLAVHCSSTAKPCTLQFVLNYTGKGNSFSPGEPLRTCWGKLSILITEEMRAEATLKGNYLSFSSAFAKQLAKQNTAAVFRRPAQGGCGPRGRSFCKSAGKISLGLMEAHLNIACIQKL